jgi:hypothetical protein
VFTSNHGLRLAVPAVPAEWVCDPLMVDVKWWLVVVSKSVCCYEIVYYLDSKWLLREIFQSIICYLR